MKRDWLLALLVLLAAATTPGIATSNEPPLADAGLDQTTTRNTTVYLDGGGSRDPDGTLTDYDWTVTAPDGTTTKPNCADCERTRFRATTVGTYEVTLDVTDDDGATATDTLYVTVQPGAPPDAALAGPNRLDTGSAGTYTADLAAGAAPLDRAIWYVDGERRGTVDLGGRAATPTRDVRFPTPGTHDVRVVTVDTDGQRGNASTRVTVTDPSDSTVDSPTPGSDPRGDNTAGDNTATTHEIDGPRVVTGGRTLTGTYRLHDGTAADWYLDDRHVDTGAVADLTLAPGTHDLYAVPHDGSGAALFPDGTQTVVADPAPNVHLQRATDGSVTTVDAYATDELGNLQSLSIIVDGKLKRTVTTTGLDRISGDGNQLTLLERLADLDPGTHRVAVRARDTRGQTDVETQRITVPGPPEVVSSGFVEDGPLDVRHPKLDPDRYTATYRIAVDLNGVDPDWVEVAHELRTEEIISEGSWNRSRTRRGRLILTKNFSRREPGDIEVKSAVEWDRGSSSRNAANDLDSVSVTTSKPVIRLNLIDSENRRTKERGARFDASSSFDPDGTSLSYFWHHIDSGQVQRGEVGKLDALDQIKLNITDDQGQTTITYKILRWFVPELSSATVEDSGPYLPNETVVYTVRTNNYELTKQRYESDSGPKSIRFGLRTNVGTVTNHTRHENEPAGGNHDNLGDTREGASYVYHEWTVSVPARELRDSEPEATIYATEREEASRTVSLPKPELYEPLNTYSDITDLEVEYLVEQSDYTTRQTSKPARRDALEAQGYDVYRKTHSGIAYHLEKRTKTQSVEYETRQKTFTNEMGRKLFLGAHPTWSSAGSDVDVREWDETHMEWRSSRRGEGKFTGATRRHKVESAEYRTEHQFEYEKTVSYQETVEYERTISWTTQKTVTREKCVAYLGCWEYEDTIEVRHSKTYEGERRVTRYRDVTDTYWSQRPRSAAHEETGRQRRIQVDDADYERQYEYAVTRHHERTVRKYLASKTVQTQSAEYEWVPYETVKSQRAKLIYTANPEVRVAETKPTVQWILRRDGGRELTRVDEPLDSGDVVRTSVEATVELRTRFRPPNTNRRGEIRKRTRIIELSESTDTFLTFKGAKNFARNEVNESDVGYE